MMPWERRRIANRVRQKYEPEPTIEEVEPVPLEVTFDMELTDLDRFFLRKWGINQC